MRETTEGVFADFDSEGIMIRCPDDQMVVIKYSNIITILGIKTELEFGGEVFVNDDRLNITIESNNEIRIFQDAVLDDVCDGIATFAISEGKVTARIRVKIEEIKSITAE